MNNSQLNPKINAGKGLQHLSKDFSVSVLQTFLGDNGPIKLESPDHEDFLFIQVLQGSLNYSVNGTFFSVNENEGLFVNSGTVSFAMCKKKRLVRFQIASISPSLLGSGSSFSSELIDPVIQKGVDTFSLRNDVPYQREVLRGVQEIVDSYASHRQRYELQLISIFYKMAYLLFPHIPLTKEKVYRGTDKKTSAMISFIDKNYSKDISLDDIAASGETSKRNANRLFLRYLSQTPKAYLIDVRLNNASSLLVDTDYPVKDVALLCGYPGVAFFVQSFRNRFGLTPGKYRKKKRGKTAL